MLLAGLALTAFATRKRRAGKHAA
nr:hypothetical protein [Janthinobacterium sp. GW460W]